MLFFLSIERGPELVHAKSQLESVPSSAAYVGFVHMSSVERYGGAYDQSSRITFCVEVCYLAFAPHVQPI